MPNLGTRRYDGRAVSVGDVVDLVVALTGANKPLQTEAERFRSENSEIRLFLLADAGRIVAAAGWCPAASLEDGLRNTVEWWRDRPAKTAIRRSAD